MPPKKRGAGVKQVNYNCFDWSTIRYDSTTGIFGQRGSGKSTFGSNLMYRNRLPRCFVICESPSIHKDYQFIPYPYRHEKYDEEFLRNFLRSQNRITKELNQKFIKYKYEMNMEVNRKKADEMSTLKHEIEKLADQHKWSANDAERYMKLTQEKLMLKWHEEDEDLKRHYKQVWDEWCLPYAVDIYIDDCSSDNSIMNSKVLRCLCNNGRHFLCRLTIMCQYQMDFPAKLRGALDRVVIFREAIYKNLERYYTYYASMFPTMDEFQQTLTQMTQGHNCMVIDMRSYAPLHERVFYCQPMDLSLVNIEVGGKEYQLFSDMYSKVIDDPTKSDLLAKAEESQVPQCDELPDEVAKLINNGGGQQQRQQQTEWRSHIADQIMKQLAQRENLMKRKKEQRKEAIKQASAAAQYNSSNISAKGGGGGKVPFTSDASSASFSVPSAQIGKMEVRIV